jgi:hypothetical protein
MKMSAMVEMMLQTMAIHGDREVTVMNEETGEILYVEGMSFDVPGTDILLETVSYGEKKMIEKLNKLEAELAEFSEEQLRVFFELLGM